MKVGITASCFDLFHAGHVLMLEEASSICDWLIVALQTDPSLDRPEKSKPIQSVYERFVQVSACKYVDEVVVYDTEADLLNVLQSRKIDVRILGEEYMNKEFTGKHLDLFEHVYNKRRHSYSSSELKQRIVERYEGKSLKQEYCSDMNTMNSTMNSHLNYKKPIYTLSEKYND
jgi:glycerol-3-phosphate cytidylyltransferase